MCHVVAYKGYPDCITKKVKNKVNFALKGCSVFFPLQVADAFTLMNAHLIEALNNDIKILKHVYNFFIHGLIPSLLFLIFSSERQNQCFHRCPRFEKKNELWGTSHPAPLCQAINKKKISNFIGKTTKCGEANCWIIIFSYFKFFIVMHIHCRKFEKCNNTHSHNQNYPGINLLTF